MGREVRRVTVDWKHPKEFSYYRGMKMYKPLYPGKYYKDSFAEWIEGKLKWDEGQVLDGETDTYRERFPEDGRTYEDNCGSACPDERDYMPSWTEEEATHYQMYENVSEGTPISPPMETPELLAQWLTDNDANAGGRKPATYEQWLAVCHGGYAPSGVFANGVFMSGVEAMTELRKKD